MRLRKIPILLNAVLFAISGSAIVYMFSVDINPYIGFIVIAVLSYIFSNITWFLEKIISVRAVLKNIETMMDYIETMSRNKVTGLDVRFGYDRIGVELEFKNKEGETMYKWFDIITKPISANVRVLFSVIKHAILTIPAVYLMVSFSSPYAKLLAITYASVILFLLVRNVEEIYSFEKKYNTIVEIIDLFVESLPMIIAYIFGTIGGKFPSSSEDAPQSSGIDDLESFIKEMMKESNDEEDKDNDTRATTEKE